MLLVDDMDVVSLMKRNAWSGVAKQVTSQEYINRCTARLAGVTLVFYRGNGSFLPLEGRQNPDYDYFWNLSVWFVGPKGEVQPHDNKRALELVQKFYSPHERMVCSYAPNGILARKFQIKHYRMFTEPDWVTPKVPRGEVYSLKR